MINATSSSNFSNVKNLTGNTSGNSTQNQVAEPEDTFESMFELKTSISFGEGGISMADLAKTMKKNADGSMTFDFSGVPGVKIERHDQK